MDSEYLKKNILPALTEALTAMASEVPEDKVEFVGKYLLKYVERQGTALKKHKEVAEAEANAKQYQREEDARVRAEIEKNAPKLSLKSQYEKFLNSIGSCSSKEDAMRAVVTFLETNMGIPSAYIAVKVPQGESETLKYLVVGPNSANILGKKLPKPSGEEGEEGAPERQGVSFEAFKLPEVPEEEPVEESEDGTTPPPKGPPPLENLIVQNTMRDKRVKYFGIPKLGAYAAIPAVYSSADHDAACNFNAGDGAEVLPSWEIAKKDNHFLIGMDTVGKYRLFEKEEIARASEMSKALVSLFVKIDETAAEKQLEFLQSDKLKTLTDLTTELTAKIAEMEAAALAEVAAAIAAAVAAAAPVEGAEPVEGSGVDPAVAELQKAKSETAAVAAVWGEQVGKSQLGLNISLLNQFVLPLPLPALRLLYAMALFLNEDPATVEDVCGDPNWESIRKIFLSSLATKIGSFDPSSVTNLVHKSNSVAAVKAYLEANGLIDGSVYPSFVPIFGSVLLVWLQKAIAAREAAMAYSAEVDKVSLEVSP